MPLDTFEDGVEAYWELYHVQGDDDYELEIMRGGSPVTLNYALLFTL